MGHAIRREICIRYLRINLQRIVPLHTGFTLVFKFHLLSDFTLFSHLYLFKFYFLSHFTPFLSHCTPFSALRSLDSLVVPEIIAFFSLVHTLPHLSSRVLSFVQTNEMYRTQYRNLCRNLYRKKTIQKYWML